MTFPPAHFLKNDTSGIRLVLRNSIASLLNPEEEPRLLRAAAIQLHSALSTVTGISDSRREPAETQETVTANGKAISPRDAARCVLDYQRTAKFMRGTIAAIKTLLSRFSDRPLNILYAGCGPFSPFALAAATEFSASEVSFTLLDIHDRSIKAAQRLFQFLEKEDYVQSYVKIDAASYRHASGKPHLVIIEAMQKGLSREPQVALTRNLAPQLIEGGVLIPQSISIAACLADLLEELPATGARTEAGRISLGHILELSKTSSCEAGEANNRIIVEVPREVDQRLIITLLMRVTIFDSLVLSDYESGITFPTFLHELGSPAPGSRIEFLYLEGNNPGFRCRIL